MYTHDCRICRGCQSCSRLLAEIDMQLLFSGAKCQRSRHRCGRKYAVKIPGPYIQNESVPETNGNSLRRLFDENLTHHRLFASPKQTTASAPTCRASWPAAQRKQRQTMTYLHGQTDGRMERWPHRRCSDVRRSEKAASPDANSISARMRPPPPPVVFGRLFLHICMDTTGVFVTIKTALE